MKQYFRLVLLCASLLGLTAILAVMFRYETHNKRGFNTAVFDRWTGTMSLCDIDGCHTEQELREMAENVTPSPPSQPKDYIAYPPGSPELR